MSAEAQLTWLYILALLFVCGLIAAWISKKKGRSVMVGFGLGMTFGFIGLIIASILPENNEEQEEWSDDVSSDL